MRRLPILTVTILAVSLNSVTVRAQTSSVDGSTETRTLLVNGSQRSYRIHLPTGYSQLTTLPLVIALHGGGGNPEQFAKDTGFDQKADAEGFIVVYPRGIGLLPTWNAIHCCGPAFNNKIDAVGVMRALIDELIGSQHVDPKRVYVTGHSNGGMLSYRLGAELSDKMAAISGSAGTIGGIAKFSAP